MDFMFCIGNFYLIEKDLQLASYNFRIFHCWCNPVDILRRFCVVFYKEQQQLKSNKNANMISRAIKKRNVNTFLMHFVYILF